MGQYTLTIKELIDNGIDIFTGIEYPIFDEAYRLPLQDKILNHFMFREIGVETPGKFIFNLRVRMKEIMPYFNKLYISQGLEQRILDNYDVTETFTKTASNNGTIDSTQNATNDVTNKRLFSDTPQSRVTLTTTQFVTDITEDDTNETNSSSGNSTSTGTGKEDWTRTMKGNIGVQTDADAIVKYEASLRNVDLELFTALNDLFMQIY
jgi:hypothetical protein